MFWAVWEFSFYNFSVLAIDPAFKFEAMNGLVAQAWDLAIVPVFAGLSPHNGFKKE